MKLDGTRRLREESREVRFQWNGSKAWPPTCSLHLHLPSTFPISFFTPLLFSSGPGRQCSAYMAHASLPQRLPEQCFLPLTRPGSLSREFPAGPKSGDIGQGPRRLSHSYLINRPSHFLRPVARAWMDGNSVYNWERILRPGSKASYVVTRHWW